MAIQAITAFEQVANNAQSTLAEDLTDVETDIDVASGHGARFPSPGNGFYATIWDADTYSDPKLDSNMEIVRVTARSTDTLTVTRGQRGTSGVAHSTGNAIRMLVDSELISDLQDAVNFLEAGAGNAGFRVFEECLGDILASSSPIRSADWHVSKAGTGANVAMDTANDSSAHPGIWRMVTGTDTNGKASIVLGSIGYPSLILGGGTWVLETLIYIGNLADGTDDYDLRFGLMDLSTGDPTNGVFFEYDRDLNTDWAICAKGAGTTRTDSNVAVGAAAWVKLRIEINAGGSSATFYVNGTSCGTVSTNLPTSGLFGCLSIVKEAGTTDRYVDVDYLDVQNRLTTAR